MNSAAHKRFLGVAQIRTDLAHRLWARSVRIQTMRMSPCQPACWKYQFLLQKYCTRSLHKLDQKSTGVKQNYKFQGICRLLDHDVEVVDTFVYLGFCIDMHGGSEPDICIRIEKARSCMKSLDRNIWRSSISLQTKIRLHNVYILPILLYGADTWSMTVASSRRLDAFDQWCLRRIVHIPYTAHIINEEVRRRTGQPPVTSVIAKR